MKKYFNRLYLHNVKKSQIIQKDKVSLLTTSIPWPLLSRNLGSRLGNKAKLKNNYLGTCRVGSQIQMVFREGKEQEISVREGMVPKVGWSFSECTQARRTPGGKRTPRGPARVAKRA